MEYPSYGNDYSWAMQYLGPGESILWHGKPQRSTPFTAYDAYMIPFSLLWCGFVVRALLTEFQDGFGVFSLFLIPFVLVGLYMVFGRLIYRWYLLKHTSYVITTQKILRRRNKKVDILQGFSLPPLNVKEHRDGLKSIVFGSNSGLQSSIFGNNRGSTFGESGFALEFLSDGERALRAISSMRGSFNRQ